MLDLDQTTAMFKDLLHEATLYAQRGGFTLTRDYQSEWSQLVTPTEPDPAPPAPPDPDGGTYS